MSFGLGREDGAGTGLGPAPRHAAPSPPSARVERFPLVDLARVAAFAGVLVLHVISPAGVGVTANILSRWAVPYFFMVTGFFSLGKGPQRLGHGLRRALLLALVASALYLALQRLGLWWSGGVPLGVAELRALAVSPSFAIYNSVPFAYHLWFLFSLVYVYAFFVLWESCSFPRWSLYLLALALFALRVHDFEIAGSPEPLGDLGEVSHCWYFVGVPMFAAGLALRDLARRGLRAPVPVLLAGLALGVGLSFVEYESFGLQEVYVGTPLVSLCVLGLCTRFSARSLSDVPLLSQVLALGSAPTLYAYVVHLAVLDWVRALWPAQASASEWWTYGVTLALSLLLGVLLAALARVARGAWTRLRRSVGRRPYTSSS